MGEVGCRLLERKFGKNHNENTLSHKLANSDVGRAITRNKGCIKVVYDVAILLLVIYNPQILPEVLTNASWTERGGDLGTALWYGQHVAGTANDIRYCKVESF